MSFVLKKFDLLVRDNSKATQEQIQNYLDKIFAHIEKNNNQSNYKKFGYAAVFDARTSEYYLYYSDNAKAFFNMTKNRYDLIPKNIITENNFLNILIKNITTIKSIVFDGLKLVTKKLRINEEGKVILPEKPMGDIVMNTVDVKKDNFYESFIVTLEDNNTLVGLSPEDFDKEVTVTYLDCDR